MATPLLQKKTEEYVNLYGCTIIDNDKYDILSNALWFGDI